MLTRNGEKSVQQGKTEDEQKRIKLSWDEVCPSLVQDVCQWQLISIFHLHCSRQEIIMAATE